MRIAAFCLLVGAFLCGQAAPNDAKRGTAEGSIRGKKVTIEYGRPELKGRALDALLAQLPEDRVWRAGTDQVTTFATEGPLVLECLSGAACSRVRAPAGGRRVPAGKYTLYVSAPSNGAVALILNSDPGIELGALGKILGVPVSASESKQLWPHLEGYNLNREKGVAGIAQTEVARALMTPGAADPPVDPFTISLQSSGASALTLTLAWADKAWSVEVRGAE
jgi:hypothetical protein